MILSLHLGVKALTSEEKMYAFQDGSHFIALGRLLLPNYKDRYSIRTSDEINKPYSSTQVPRLGVYFYHYSSEIHLRSDEVTRRYEQSVSIRHKSYTTPRIVSRVQLVQSLIH